MSDAPLTKTVPGPSEPPRLHGEGCICGDYTRHDCPVKDRPKPHAYLAKPIMEWLGERADTSLAGLKFREAIALIERLTGDRDERERLRAMIAERELGVRQERDRLRAAISDADGCFEAALVEGWIDALANGDIERIRDLWYRRIAMGRISLNCEHGQVEPSAQPFDVRKANQELCEKEGHVWGPFVRVCHRCHMQTLVQLQTQVQVR